jgi:hypothetical protein
MVQAKSSLRLFKAETRLTLLESGDSTEVIGAVLEELDDGLPGIVALAAPGLPSQLFELCGEILRHAYREKKPQAP